MKPRWEVREVVSPLSGSHPELWGTSLGVISRHWTRRGGLAAKRFYERRTTGVTVPTTYRLVVERSNVHRRDFLHVMSVIVTRSMDLVDEAISDLLDDRREDGTNL